MADDAVSTPQPVAETGTGTATPTLAPGTGTATPRSALSDIPLSAEQRSLSLKVSLADLTARASGLYAHKDYEGAAETYAQAAEMQAEMNGEMSHENAEILFLYGRSLFKVGQQNSDVLGGRAPDAGPKAKSKKGKGGTKKANGSAGTAPKEEEEVTVAVAVAGPSSVAQEATENNGTPEADRVAEEAVKIILADETNEGKAEEKELEAKKPLFQFTGDENWDVSDEEEGDEPEGEEDEEEEDDLAAAFEILDLARVLFKKQLDERLAEDTTEDKGKEKANGDDAGLRHIQERLADTHDLLVEISLENEQYPTAIRDARQALKYKQDLWAEDSELVAEAHYKLSLALEFASITSQKDEEGESGAGPKEVNQELRDEAAKELEASIASTKMKLQNKEVELATLHSPEDNDITRKQIVETKEIIAEMEGRLVELRAPPIDMEAALGVGPIGGILGATLGESAGQAEARIEEAKKTATDLTGLVRKREKKAAATTTTTTTSEATAENGTKRKADYGGDAGEASKKVKTDESDD